MQRPLRRARLFVSIPGNKWKELDFKDIKVSPIADGGATPPWVGGECEFEFEWAECNTELLDELYRQAAFGTAAAPKARSLNNPGL
jgi:hypothetical protein